MAKHPLNLVLRFLLELVNLAALAFWGWVEHTGLARWLWVLLLPLAAAAVWGIFRVNDDPKKAPVRIPGWLRLVLELAYFTGGVLALWAAGRPTLAIVFAAVTLAHYLISTSRVLWLLKQ